MNRVAFGLMALLVALASSFSTRTADAAPMYTDLATVQIEAKTIVTGKVRWVTVPSTTGPGSKAGLVIDVDGTLRGTPPAVMTVDESPDGHIFVQDGERVVAFVDGKNALRWIGRKLAGPDLEHGVLELQGFFDFNAHIVHPGMMTFAALKTYLGGGALKNRFAATIAFPDHHGGFKPSSRNFTLDWDPTARTGTVSGFSPACLALNTVFGLEWGAVKLRFSDTCSYGGASRSLSLDGKPTGVDATGAITVDLVPTEPLLEEQEFDPYVTDGHAASLTRVVRVSTSGGDWSWRVGEALVDPSGKARASGGSGSSMGQSGKTQATHWEQYWEFGGTKIVLTRTTATSSGTGIGTDSELLAAIDRGDWSCSLQRAGAAPLPCTLRPAPPIVTRR